MIENDIRVDDSYLMTVLRLPKGFIVHHARAMGNRTRPRSYFLDTVIAYLRQLESEAQRKRQFRAVRRSINKQEIIADIERVRTIYAMKKKGKVG